MERSTISAVIVLYNPDQYSLFGNIESCVSQVQHTFLIDNSENPDSQLLDRLKNLTHVSYIWNNGNQGIAHALNLGAAKARELNYQWLVTLDQDTLLPSNFVERIAAQIDSDAENNVGILAPAYENGRTIAVDGAENGFQGRPKAVLFTMTSGNFLNLRLHDLVGGFMDALFIDHVDHEYCLRLNANGYKTIC